ncbi:MAG: 4-alpha-glucanotransferase [Lachnospiraceae bacterium]|nr:4-alpha-glucanotransferase [Lachnospiraceae bacterium]
MRASGILMPVFSLPSRYGIGSFSKSAYQFVDMLKKAGQKYWQILPLCPTSYGDSPYQSFSTYAGNPYFIDLDQLIEEKLLTRKECQACDFGDDPQDIDYGKLYENRFKLLRKAYERANVGEDQEFEAYRRENAWWLDDYALFMAVKDRFDGVAWNEWAEDIRLRWSNAMDYYRRELYYEIEFYSYLQFVFMKQWKKLKNYANINGIEIIGDIPIYVAFDSADAWANPELFQFDAENLPTAVAGCPPDGFSADGQLWGNPLYRWDYHRETGFDWWIRRIAYCSELYDVVRIDHFRGFDEYYSIPYGDTTARNGHWEKGPGIALFEAAKNRLGELNIIAEDLGYITDSVKKLVADSGFPGMKVLEFAFDSREKSDYLPYTYEKNSVVYTGTHDNETIAGWYAGLDKSDLKMCTDYMNIDRIPGKEYHWDFIRLAMLSVSDLCVIPIQDYLGLDNRARINHPSTLGTNWRWRLAKGQLSASLLKEIREMTRISGRLQNGE